MFIHLGSSYKADHMSKALHCQQGLLQLSCGAKAFPYYRPSEREVLPNETWRWVVPSLFCEGELISVKDAQGGQIQSQEKREIRLLEKAHY